MTLSNAPWIIASSHTIDVQVIVKQTQVLNRCRRLFITGWSSQPSRHDRLLQNLCVNVRKTGSRETAKGEAVETT